MCGEYFYAIIYADHATYIYACVYNLIGNHHYALKRGLVGLVDTHCCCCLNTKAGTNVENNIKTLSHYFRVVLSITK